jgi:hypothetical protein
MAPRVLDSLPGVLQQVDTKPLFVMRLSARPLQVVGATPGVSTTDQSTELEVTPAAPCDPCRHAARCKGAG